MAAATYYSPFIPAFNSNGSPVPGGQLRFRLTGTTTATPIYTTSALDVEHTNPVVANAAGRFPAIYLSDAVTYRVDILDADGTQLDSIDPYIAARPGPAGAAGPAGTAAANSGVSTTGWTTDVASTSASSEWHILSAPTGPFTNSAGTDDRVRASLLANVSKFNQGPTGHATYYDTVIAFGLNMTQSYAPLNTAMPSASYRIESKFAQGGATDPFAVEFHTTMHSKDATPVEFRTYSAFVPHLKADWAQSAANTIRGGQLSLMDGSISPDVSGTERIKFDFRPGNNIIQLAPNGAERAPGFSLNSNGVYFARQFNAAGSAFISLPFLNANDQTEVSAAMKVASAAKADATFGITAFNVGQCTSLAANGYLDFVVSQAATTGATYPFVRQVNCSGTGASKIENLGAGALTFDLASAGAGTGFLVNGTKVVGARSTGWTAMTGTGSKAALAAAAAGTASASYVQAELQGALNRIAALEARLKSYDDALVAHGLIGA